MDVTGQGIGLYAWHFVSGATGLTKQAQNTVYEGWAFVKLGPPQTINYQGITSTVLQVVQLVLVHCWS